MKIIRIMVNHPIDLAKCPSFLMRQEIITHQRLLRNLIQLAIRCRTQPKEQKQKHLSQKFTKRQFKIIK